MKRKLFSAILFGALLATSTSGLTSCKDYDDDITNLQGQIDKLATKDELSTKASELATSISQAQQAANAAAEVAKAAQTAANNASTDAKAAADAAKAAQTAADKVAGDLATAVSNAAQQIQDAVKDLATKQQVTDAVKEVKDKYDAQAKELKALSDRLAKVEAKLGMGEGGEDIDLTEIQKELEAIEDELELLIGSYSSMITSISVFKSGDDYAGAVATNKLTFTEVTENKNVFPAKDNITDKKYTFTKGWKLEDDASLIVRVTPASATLDAANVRLINSQGKDLSDLLTCTKVEPYTDLLYTATTRANTYPTGLYKVTYTLNAGWTANAFAAAKETTVDGVVKNILYAVAVVNSDTLVAEDRLVASEWNVVLANEAAKTPNSLKINGTEITEIQNRYGTVRNPDNTIAEEELVWNNASLPSAPSVAKPKLFGNVAVATDDTPNYQEGDDRRYEKLLKVQENKDIEIKFDKKIKGFYVETDYRFRERNSNPSEIVAWNSYTYDKVGKYDVNGNCIQKATMIEGNKGTIKITNVGDGKYDVIGFRIFAVNLDGTLLDPDGIAFYVGVGDEVATDTYNAVVDLQDGNKEAWVPVTGFLKGVKYSGWTIDNENPMYGADNDGTQAGTTASVALTVNYYKADKQTEVTNFANDGDQIAWMKVTMAHPENYIDGATYKQTMKMTKSEGNEDYDQKVITLNVTKKMPETFPSKFGFLAGQPNVNGVFDAYIVPGTAPAATLTASYALKNQASGYYALSNVFNIPTANYGTYSFAVKGAAKGGNPVRDGGADITTFDANKGYSFTVGKEYIKGDVTYPITAKFNYTGISTKWDATERKWKKGKDYPVAYTGNLGITMKCWHSANALAWSTVPSIKWVADPETGDFVNRVDLRTLKVTNSYDNAFFGGTFAKLLDNGWLSDGATTGKIVSATLKSGDTEYFSVTVDTYNFNTGKKDSEGKPLPADYATCLVFEQNQNTSKPNVHNETLTIVTKDAYGHEVKNEITVEVAPAE